MTLFKTLIAAAVTAATLPATAFAFTAENRAQVTPLSGGTFQVSPERYFGVPGQWCGAADYAVRALGADWSQRIYVLDKQGRDVVFGLTPQGNTPSSITVVSNSAKTPGANFSVQRAFAFCIDQRTPEFLFGRVSP